MQRIVLTQENQEEILAEAVKTLHRGGIIVYPTDTLYGMGANPFDEYAVRRIFLIKKRPFSKPLPMIARSISMAKKLAYIDAEKEKILKSIWPGGVSVVLYKRELVPDIVSSGKNTVSLRIPNNPFCLELIKIFNSPIISTSANISDKNGADDPEKIAARFKRELYKPDLIIDSGKLKRARASTLLDLTAGKPKITRVGPVTPKELYKILGT